MWLNNISRSRYVLNISPVKQHFVTVPLITILSVLFNAFGFVVGDGGLLFVDGSVVLRGVIVGVAFILFFSFLLAIAVSVRTNAFLKGMREDSLTAISFSAQALSLMQFVMLTALITYQELMLGYLSYIGVVMMLWVAVAAKKSSEFIENCDKNTFS
jgi:hypothetical protein